MARPSTPWLVAIALVIGLGFRLALVSSWHAPAGDGLHYFQLSQELRAHGRFAYGPEPRELTYTRIPGYEHLSHKEYMRMMEENAEARKIHLDIYFRRLA